MFFDMVNFVIGFAAICVCRKFPKDIQNPRNKFDALELGEMLAEEFMSKHGDMIFDHTTQGLVQIKDADLGNPVTKDKIKFFVEA